ncbi:MAG TPA: response regulator [Chthoniobacterales bacterium]
MKILLVEDHADSRRNLQRLIERRGHEVVAVASAEEAATVLAQQCFPFLILDWMLPGKSGVELCRELRAQERGDEMFILLVTARGDTEDLHQALEAGANDYLTKPLDLGLLNVRLSVAERQIRDLSERNQARAELQQSAEKMTSILENTTDGFFAVDQNWNFTHLNAEAETLLGRSREELYGTNLWEKFPEEVGTVFEASYRRVMDEQVALEFEASDADGKKWFEVHAYPSGGGVSVFFRDITERKRGEDERLTTSKLESLGTLAGGIAHDLNNILTVISGNIGLAQIDAPSDCRNLLSFLSKAGQAAQHAAHLSSQLLTFSKGGAPLKKVVSLGQVVGQAAEFSLYGSNLRADVDIAPNLWPAEVDAGQIEQVMNALILNAREAMPHGGSIRIAARNVELEEKPGLLTAGRYLEISVRDHGIGVSDALVTKIFDPYFTTKPTASGLGLAISYSIVKKHGGALLLESSSAEGSTFTFYLPATADKVARAEPAGVAPSVPKSQQRVLVMDDEAAIRDLTSQLLSTLGYQVTAVPDGTEAIKSYERALRRGEHFQAVILDATVRGGLGGVATIERLRGMDPGVNAIICSGYSDEAALSEFLAYGFRGALPKPFTRGDLADALKRLEASHAA